VKDMVSVEMAAKALRRNPELLRRWLRDGRLHGEKFGRDWFIPRDTLRRFKAAEPARRKRKPPR